MNNRWFVFFLLLLGSFGRVGAQCPSLDEMRELLFNGERSHLLVADSVRAVCPSSADSLSMVYYGRSGYFFGQNDLAGAIEMGELALAEFRIVYPPGEEGLLLGRMNYNLGLFHLNRGAFERARTYFREAERIFPLVDHEEREKRLLRTMLDLGYANNQLGDFEVGVGQLERVRDRAAKSGFPFYTAEANRLLGEQYLERKELGAAAGAMQLALEQMTELGETRRGYAVAINLGNIYYKQKEYEAARQAIAPAFKVQDQLPLNDLARMQSLLALLSLRTGDAVAAERWFEENRAIALEYGDAHYIAQAYDNGAEISLLQKNYDEAINRVGEAITQFVPNYRMSDEKLVPTAAEISASAYKIDLLIYLGDLARMLEAADRQADAIEVLVAADGLIDELRAGLAGGQSKLFWRQRAMPIYERAIRLTHELKRPAEAFRFFEKSRAILLLEALAEADAISLLPEEESVRLSRATNWLLAKQRAQLTAKPKDRAAGEVLLQAARDSLVGLREELSGRYPGIFASVATISEAEARTQLAALGYDKQLAYFLGEEEAFLLVLDQEGARTISLGPTAELESVVGDLLGYFTGAAKIDGGAGAYLSQAYTSHQLLLAPANCAQNERLLILPDGILGYLPFAALVTEARAADIASAPYLLRRNLVGYAQSSTVLARQNEVSRNPSAYLFAPFTEAISGNSAPVLTHSQTEIGALSSEYSGLEQVGASATRSALLRELPLHGLLHLSTHAYATRDGGGEPPRILTADAPVYLPDIYGLRLNAELVTLSACQSNIGPLARGEGVLGLGRAFTAAGARGVVASLWSLNDRATADIITTFYDELSGGANKPQALHYAQLEYLDRTDLPAYLKSPYYWAGLTYYGNAGTLPAGGFSWWIVGVLGLVVTLGIWWWRGKPQINNRG